MENNPLQFNAERHLYTLDGIPITGATTILGMIAKPALLGWAANQAVDFLLASSTKEIDVRIVPEEMFDQARKAHTRRTEAAADTGTKAHKWIERWIKGERPERDESIALMTDNFIKWAQDAQVEFISSERQVYSRKHWFAGTLDFYCKIGEQYFIGDVKTSSGIYDEYFFQTSAYQLALQEMEPTLPVHGHIIVNCKKDGGFDVKESRDYKKNVKAFLGALAIYRRKGELNKENKPKKYGSRVSK